jgi:hypothetical protein
MYRQILFKGDPNVLLSLLLTYGASVTMATVPTGLGPVIGEDIPETKASEVAAGQV